MISRRSVLSFLACLPFMSYIKPKSVELTVWQLVLNLRDELAKHDLRKCGIQSCGSSKIDVIHTTALISNVPLSNLFLRYYRRHNAEAWYLNNLAVMVMIAPQQIVDLYNHSYYKNIKDPLGVMKLVKGQAELLLRCKLSDAVN